MIGDGGLPEPVERVARFLREARVEARLEEFEQGTPTAEAAARAIGCDAGQIVKSLVFECSDGRPVLVMVPGDRHADRRKVATAAGCGSARAARAADVVRLTGFEAGGVAPFPLEIETALVDRSLLAHDAVWIGAGSSRHMAALAPSDLVRLARARPVDVVAER